MIEPKLKRLVNLAREILVRKRARRAFRDAVAHKAAWHVKKGKGFGVPAKKENFKRWYERHIGKRNCVYALWAHKRCMYVGRTQRGKGRPTHCFDKFWFPSVTRIDVFSIRTPRLVPMAECLAIDLFRPRRNIHRSSHSKYSVKCPVCSAVKDIRGELKTVFKLRG
jgi:hypothetical protein